MISRTRESSKQPRAPAGSTSLVLGTAGDGDFEPAFSALARQRA
jgi:hypothetical protein